MTKSAQLELSSDRVVPLRRVQLDLPPRALDRLQQLKSDTEASTYAEVIKNALKLYAAAIELEKAGKEFMVKNKDGTISPLIIFR